MLLLFCTVNPSLRLRVGSNRVRMVTNKTRELNRGEGRGSSLAAFLLAKLFSDLDNPDCLDFRASRNKNLKKD